MFVKQTSKNARFRGKKCKISDSTAVSILNTNVISSLKTDDRNKNQIPTAEYFLNPAVVHLIKILLAFKEKRILIRPILFATVRHWSLSKIGKSIPQSKTLLAPL